MEQVSVNGAVITYEAKMEGTEQHTPVLYLHGWGCDHRVFTYLYRGLNLPYITVDFPGHGLSPEPPFPWAVADFAEQIVKLLEKLSVPKVDIIAHSFGGRVALRLSSAHPELVSRLVITGGAGLRAPLSPEKQKRQEGYRKKQELFGRLKAFKPLEKPMESLQKTLRDRHASPDYLALSDSMKECFKKIVNEDLSPLLSRVQAPTLLIWGGNDTETPLWMGQKMEKEIRDAALIVFEGRSHFAFAEEPDRFLLIMKSFLKGESAC